MKSRVRARFRLTIFALALGTAWGAEAQRAVVRGRVVEENGKPLEGVQILIELLESSARKYTGTSKANGDFVRVGLVTGTYRITCSKEGFVPAILDVPVKGTDNVDVGNVILTKVPEGFVTEEQRAEAQKHLEAAMSSSDQANYQTTIESLKKFLETVRLTGSSLQRRRRIREAPRSGQRAHLLSEGDRAKARLLRSLCGNG